MMVKSVIVARTEIAFGALLPRRDGFDGDIDMSCESRDGTRVRRRDSSLGTGARGGFGSRRLGTRRGFGLRQLSTRRCPRLRRRSGPGACRRHADVNVVRSFRRDAGDEQKGADQRKRTKRRRISHRYGGIFMTKPILR
jgi:hypothetical protein